MHLHGPRNNPCLGSNKPPLPVSEPQLTPLPDEFVRVHQHVQCNASIQINQVFNLPVLQVSVIKHIPKFARQHCAAQLTILLNNVTRDNNDSDSWRRLLNFGNIMLLAPPRGGKKYNLTTIIKNRLVTDNYNNAINKICKTHVKNHLASLTASVEVKIEDGNIKAALRLLSSEDKQAEDNDTTISALKARHPQAASDRKFSPSPQEYTVLRVSENAVKSVIRSFPAGSSGGPDGVCP